MTLVKAVITQGAAKWQSRKENFTIMLASGIINVGMVLSILSIVYYPYESDEYLIQYVVAAFFLVALNIGFCAKLMYGKYRREQRTKHEAHIEE